MGHIAAGLSQNIPTSGPAQAAVQITNSAPALGDVIDFVLIAASSDTNRQKKLYFGASASGFHNARSKITIAPGAGFHAVGQSATANPTLIDWLDSSSTYYTFVDSGAFTVQYASFTHMDESGIQLWNSGPFSINNSTFDYVGSGSVSTGTLFTLNGVTQSTITLTDVTYGSNGAASPKYNYT